ncbi:unnamed protein product [Lupinus luteus]|uniref:Uncharacterized protein n=1 Tax=Lupinus luteus TaxID=3873 RepID=A0AAV1XZ79_LUPLU
MKSIVITICIDTKWKEAGLDKKAGHIPHKVKEEKRRDKNSFMMDLPQELLGKPVEPTVSVEPSPYSKALEPHATIAGFTN